MLAEGGSLSPRASGGVRMMHEWAFMVGVSTIGATGERVVAVCGKCGLIRTDRVATATSEEGRIDLRGDCPGKPQAPTDSPPREPRVIEL